MAMQFSPVDNRQMRIEARQNNKDQLQKRRQNDLSDIIRMMGFANNTSPDTMAGFAIGKLLHDWWMSRKGDQGPTQPQTQGTADATNSDAPSTGGNVSEPVMKATTGLLGNIDWQAPTDYEKNNGDVGRGFYSPNSYVSPTTFGIERDLTNVASMPYIMEKYDEYNLLPEQWRR